MRTPQAAHHRGERAPHRRQRAHHGHDAGGGDGTRADVAVVARNTAAHAVPSGYGNSSAERTMSSRRSGTIAAMPRKPPRSARIATCQNGGAMPHKKSAGIVKIVPVASDDDAEPMVCEMF